MTRKELFFRYFGRTPNGGQLLHLVDSEYFCQSLFVFSLSLGASFLFHKKKTQLRSRDIKPDAEERESVLDSIVPKRDGGKKKKNVVSWTLWRALLFSPTPPLFLFRAHLQSRSSDDFRTFRRREEGTNGAHVSSHLFLFCAHANYVPLF